MNEYLVWKRNNPLYGRSAVLLSDALCAKEGQIPSAYEPCRSLSAVPGEKTAWFEVCDFFGLVPAGNASMAGSRIVSSTQECALYPAMCNSLRLIEALQEKPDVLLVLAGTQDVLDGIHSETSNTPDLRTFAAAAALMLDRIVQSAPDTKVYVFSIPTLDPAKPADPCNAVLEGLCKERDIAFLQLESDPVGIRKDFSLTSGGMHTLANAMIAALSEEGKAYIPSEGEEILFASTPPVQKEEDLLGDLEILPEPEKTSKKEEHSDPLLHGIGHQNIFDWLNAVDEPAEEEKIDVPVQQKEVQSPQEAARAEEPIRLSFTDMPIPQYIDEEDWEDSEDKEGTVVELSFLEPEPPRKTLRKDKPAFTPVIFESTLKLKNLESGEIVSVQKASVSVGRQMKGNDIKMKGGMISRNHAVFTYQNGMWYLMDLGSVNGTFLNEKRLLPDVQYLLQENDTIRFSASSMQFVSAREDVQ